ncbi:hypothetical protein GCK72_003396 [Caenorhabditis remanei]|uniref:Uncharacterized protein n=1 Tax=Caenorhabditis remanei TaxID=31234 RepID=A0A6A5HUV2_CAERE|nr:hypothetical protein GCK72_003396 [Caenorhabditis remanei]KAF1771569.1 hypothetical protein GCK72_003396 [Caenorhabditis remanei]
MSVAVLCLLAVTVLSASPATASDTDAPRAAPHRQVVTLRHREVPLYSSIAAFDYFGMWALETCEAAVRRDDTSKGKLAKMVMTMDVCRERAYAYSYVGCNHQCKNLFDLYIAVCEENRQIEVGEMKEICCPIVYRTSTLEENRAEQRAQAEIYPHYFEK